jgi:hypothetical protein
MTRHRPPRGLLVSALATLVALAGLLGAPAASATLYKWVDANGRVVYSDQPPMGNFRADVVGAGAPSANPDAVKEMATKDAEFKKRQSDRVDDAKKSDKGRGDAQKLAAVCSQVRSQSAGLRNAYIAMFKLDEKGERVLLDEAQRRAEADRLDQLARERKCPPA